jgi:hypothetical protein
MPAVSEKQRRLMAIALHHPEQVHAKNRGVLKMNNKALHDYAATRGLGGQSQAPSARGQSQAPRSGQRHDHTPANGGFAHAGSTREGPHLSQALAHGSSYTVGARETEDAFSNADILNDGPHEGEAGNRGPSAGVAGAQEPKAFAQSGTSNPGPRFGRATATGSAPAGAGAVPRIRRASGFDTNTQEPPVDGGPGHFDVARGREQTSFDGGREGAYDAGRKGNFSPVGRIRGMRHQQGT